MELNPSKKKLVFILILLFSINISFSLSISNDVLNINSTGSVIASSLPRLHTDGPYIKDKQGNIITLRGVAVTELNTPKPYGVYKYWGQEDGKYKETYGYLPNSFDRLRESGVNCVRLSINWYSWMGIEHPYNPIPVEEAIQYKQSVDYFIQELNDRKIYVYLDFHAADTLTIDKWKYFIDTYLDTYYLFWQDIAARYLNDPGVFGCQLFNEPRSFYNSYPYQGFWWDFMLETAQRIHAVNPEMLVLVASTDNTINGTKIGYPADAGYKVVSDQYVLDPLPEPNIVYVFHFHFPMEAPNWNVMQSYTNNNLIKAKQEFEAFLYIIAFRALDAGLPIMNCEFNVKHYDYATGNELLYPYLNVTADLLDLMNKYGCHWTWWSWQGSVGYSWDYSSDGNYLVYMGDAINYPYVWNELSKLGETWKSKLN